MRFLALLLAVLPVGHSVDGRPIRPIVAGSGPVRLLVVGCIHGTECAGMPIAWRLAGSGPLGGGGSIVVVPNLNPDGYAAGTRTNAHGVDLNRDFYARTQPETRYAETLIRRLHPRISVWFHQPEARVRAWGPSRRVGARLAALAGARYDSVAWPPGSASNWQNRHGMRSFVVELPAGPVPPGRVARWVRALRTLAAEGPGR